MTQRRPISAHWTDADLEKLAEMIRAGATPSRCAVVFRRRVDAVKTKARQLGIPFPPEWKVRKVLRDKMGSGNSPPTSANSAVASGSVISGVNVPKMEQP